MLFGAAVELVAGGGTGGDGGAATNARLRSPFGVDFDRAGNLYLVELTGQQVRRIDPRGIISTVAGTGEKGSGGDGGPATGAQFNGMHNLAVAPDDSILLADTWNGRVRRIDAITQKISTLAGTGTQSFSGDGGPAREAGFSGIYCIALGPKGKTLYLADLENRRVRAIDLERGTVTTIAGNGERGVPPDGAQATRAPLVDPRAVAADDRGNVYVLERSGNALRVVDREGRIRTVAGTGKKGLSGDEGPALQATFDGPKHLCLDLDGNVVMADTENHVIRRYLPREGRIVRVAGSGVRGTRGVGGPPAALEMNQPHGVYVHRDGTLYISDASNHRVLKIAGAGRKAP
jgi:DNA-binding beta-propeller fold protein YncE